ncbi:CdaR family transcriptional regulator [Bacillus piscicola]|uniref:CdaR family transcriptional regulator n=1 Tax=Bacillus piscicola TaxID=1632684 RepID=UPI001F09D1FC|nr:sugar diacid recognition domain-containing protein [Bacillus piscicola]
MLTKEIADMIVKETSVRLNRNINMMNEEGVILASCDEERITDIHEGAVHVLKSGETLIIYPGDQSQYKGSQPGINIPIVENGTIVGVIGITGHPDEVQHLGELVKMTTELMMEQKEIAAQLEWRQRMKEMMIADLLQSKPAYNHIERGLDLLGIHLEAPFTAFLIQLADRTTSNQAIIDKLERIIGKSTSIVGFINVNQVFITVSNLATRKVRDAAERMADLFNTLQIPYQIALSQPFLQMRSFYAAYEECNLALQASDPNEKIVFYSEIEAKALVFQLDKERAKRFTQRVITKTIKKHRDTLTCFFSCNFNIQQTADALFIHRNTLLYRLNKIKEETGYDPKNFHDALTLQLAIWIFERNYPT